jgi:hypothetical protein
MEKIPENPEYEKLIAQWWKERWGFEENKE